MPRFPGLWQALCEGVSARILAIKAKFGRVFIRNKNGGIYAVFRKRIRENKHGMGLFFLIGF